MPTYVCTTSEGLLGVDQRKAIAAAIAKAHQEATGAAGFFAQVVFDEKGSSHRFLGAQVSSAHVWVRGDIRAGRTTEQRRGLAQAIMRDVARIADVQETDIWVYLCELAPTDMIEYGHVLPPPGEEQAWFEGLPPRLQVYLKGLVPQETSATD